MSSFDSYTTVKNLFVLGTTASAIASGGLLFTSYVHTPAYVKNPSDESLLTQWKIMFNLGKVVVPSLAVVAGACHFLNAYGTHTQPQSIRFIGAGLLSIATLPWTLVAIAPTNLELMAREEKREGGGAESQKGIGTKDLVSKWSNLSAVRGWLMFAGTLLGFDAMLHLSF